MDAIQHIIASPAFHDYLAILKGARNGFVYGVKVRFPHALVMSILFGRGECVQYILSTLVAVVSRFQSAGSHVFASSIVQQNNTP